MPDERAPNQIPPGLKLRHTLRGHTDFIKRLTWSPDGRTLASSSADWTIRLWSAETGQHLRTLRDHEDTIYGIAWSPDGRTLASASADHTVRLWDVETGAVKYVLKGHTGLVMGVAWSPDGRTLASCSDDSTVHLWGADGSPAGILRPDGTWFWRHKERQRKLRRDLIQSVAWAPDGGMLVSGSLDSSVVVWDTATQQPLEAHSNGESVFCVIWPPTRKVLALSYRNGTIQLHSVHRERHDLILEVPPILEGRHVLEGHTRTVTSVSFSSDGRLLASKSKDGTVRIWRCDKHETVATLAEPHSRCATSGLSFHPSLPVLATLGDRETCIRVWDVDVDALLGAAPAVSTVHYTNAKVVLVGDSGVGKTGLAVRLAEDEWRPTPGSTHGMNVWPLHSETEREVMLWDLAGQDEYRLIHQLFMNETHVALLLYDPTRSHDSFFGVKYWEKALRNAAPEEVKKILVAARVDVGSVRMTAADIEAYCGANGYVAHLATSAETGEGCEALRKAIMRAIPWEQLPRTSSPEVFKRVKDFLAEVRQGNRVMVSEDALMAEFNARAGGEEATEAEFRTVIGHVETAGLIKRLSFGDLVLLKPELLNGYASDIIDGARRHADGLGAVSKADVLEGRVSIREEGGLKQADRIFLLHATVELFLRLGLALEQNGNLVFPSKFNRRMPPLEQDPVVEVEFTFEGPVENLYTTLIVKLYYGGVFRLKQLWKNAAEFVNGRSQVCGFQLQNKGDGQGRLKVFYAEGVRDDDKALFLKIVADHFAEKRVEVRRERLYRCPECREPARDRNAVSRALERGVAEMPCLYCFKTFPLVDALEMLYRDDEKFLSQIAAMESKAEASMERGGDLVAASAEMKTEGFRRWAGGAGIATVAIVFTDVIGSTGLTVEMGDEPWRGVREAHFARARKLIDEGHGYFIKSIGDSVMAAFHSASDALDFALAFKRDTGHRAVRIRAGLHVGPVEVASADAFGQHVNLASRVEGKAKEGGIWMSDKVKEDVDTLRAERHSKLKWTEHRDQELRGFPDRLFVLWSVEEPGD